MLYSNNPKLINLSTVMNLQLNDIFSQIENW